MPVMYSRSLELRRLKLKLKTAQMQAMKFPENTDYHNLMNMYEMQIATLEKIIEKDGERTPRVY